MLNLQRLISKSVRKTATGCWEWQGVMHNGYGHVRLDGFGWRVHRLSYRAFKGSMEDLSVLHLCHNRKCCNPEHLVLGTQRDNVQHDVSRGLRFGDKNSNSKLTDEQVLKIRSMRGMRQHSIADLFGISQSLVSKIQLREIWNHI